MTTEEQLNAIIEAQANNGYIAYAPFFDGREVEYQHGVLTDVAAKFSMMVLPILLDPQGLRAVWGDQNHEIKRNRCVKCLLILPKYMDDVGSPEELTSSCFEAVSIQILNTWLTSNGDAAATIDTAFSLLPK